LEVSATAGKEGILLRDTIRTRFENVDDRRMGDASVLAIDADAQSIAWSCSRHEESAPAAITESEPARDDSLDDGFGLVAKTSR
jgi:hypothetical protein